MNRRDSLKVIAATPILPSLLQDESQDKSQNELQDTKVRLLPINPTEELTREEALKFLHECPIIIDNEFKVRIYYKGNWLVLGETDKCDDVRCTIDCYFYRDELTGKMVPGFPAGSPLKHYISHCNYGARVDNYGFYVIARMTDG